MAKTFAQMAEQAKTPMTRGAIEQIHKESDLFKRLPWIPIDGVAYAYDPAAALPGTHFRGVNEHYLESTSGVVNPQVEVLKAFGGRGALDNYTVAANQTAGLGDLLAEEVTAKTTSLHTLFADALFNGDSTVNTKSFDGLRKRLTGEQVVDATAPLTDIAALEDLDALFAAVGGSPDVVYAGANVLGRYKALARRLGGADFIKSEITGKVEFTWNGVEIIDPGKLWTGRKILGPAPDGTEELFAVRFAQTKNDEGIAGITNVGVVTDKPAKLPGTSDWHFLVEMYGSIIVQGGQAAARLRGITRS